MLMLIESGLKSRMCVRLKLFCRLIEEACEFLWLVVFLIGEKGFRPGKRSPARIVVLRGLSGSPMVPLTTEGLKPGESTLLIVDLAPIPVERFISKLGRLSASVLVLMLTGLSV